MVHDDEAFYNLKPGVPSEAEVFVLSTLLVASMEGRDLDHWLSEVENDSPRMIKLGNDWAPMANSVLFASQGMILSSLEAAIVQRILVDGGTGVIETVAKMAKSWNVSHGKHIYRELDWLTPIPQRRARPRQTRPEVADLARRQTGRAFSNENRHPKLISKKFPRKFHFSNTLPGL